MADAVVLDASEVHRLAADLGRASGRVVLAVDAVLKRAAQNVKDELVTDARASRHFGEKQGLAASISYDRHYQVGMVGYEVGPDKDRRGGAIANIAYFGGVRGGGATLDLDRPLVAESARMIRALGDVAGGLL